MSDDKELAFNDAPIITYTNRLQRRMEFVSGLLSMVENVRYPMIVKVAAVRILCMNLPPTAKTDGLKNEYNKLMGYSDNEGLIPNEQELDKIYNTISDWIYKNLLQDAFKFRPKNLKSAYLSGE